jgi:hypothetical protein
MNNERLRDKVRERRVDEEGDGKKESIKKEK